MEVRLPLGIDQFEKLRTSGCYYGAAFFEKMCLVKVEKDYLS